MDKYQITLTISGDIPAEFAAVLRDAARNAVEVRLKASSMLSEVKPEVSTRIEQL